MSENIDKKRHSLAHIMASAILELYPKTKLGMGPAVENGFYYDFQLQKPLQESELQEIKTTIAHIKTDAGKWTELKDVVLKRICKLAPPS